MTSFIWIPLICAIISPFIWGFMNILDKFVISHKVKNPLSFSVVAGIVNLGIGSIIALCLDWSGVTKTDIFFPALVGVLLGSQFFLYYHLLGKEDVSNVIGLIYFYPIIVAILSFLYLNESFPLISYLGLGIIMVGVFTLSINIKKIKLKATLWMIITLIVVVGLYEFFIKVSTTNLPELNGIAISHIFVGLTILPGLFVKKIRKGFTKELKNTKWSILNESFTFLGVLTLYYAMSGLPATIVSSIAATQPLAVLMMESFANKIGIRLSNEGNFRKKLVPILLIVLGIVLLYIPEMLKELK